jgi:hypothetical protein
MALSDQPSPAGPAGGDISRSISTDRPLNPLGYPSQSRWCDDRPLNIRPILDVNHRSDKGERDGNRRREASDGPRFDVEWRLPDRTKRRKTFPSER